MDSDTKEGHLIPTSRGGFFDEATADVTGTLRAGADAPKHDSDNRSLIASKMQVRRLTPRECERLQGFPDDYTLLPGKSADGPRYRALGNSMAVPVIRWIGQRLELAEKIP